MMEGPVLPGCSEEDTRKICDIMFLLSKYPFKLLKFFHFLRVAYNLINV